MWFRSNKITDFDYNWGTVEIIPILRWKWFKVISTVIYVQTFKINLPVLVVLNCLLDWINFLQLHNCSIVVKTRVSTPLERSFFQLIYFVCVWQSLTKNLTAKENSKSKVFIILLPLARTVYFSSSFCFPKSTNWVYSIFVLIWKKNVKNSLLLWIHI